MPSPHVTFADGSTFTVETADGLVQLVTRDAAGAVLQGLEFTPDEARHLGQALTAATFTARGLS